MFFATNIANFLACQHIATLERAEAAGEISRKHYADPGAELLRKLGLEHEQKYLRELVETKGLKVVEISTDGGWLEAARATREAMAAGAEVIYQATFMSATEGDSLASDGAVGRRDGVAGRRDACGPSEELEWGGRADFLLRVEIPSKLGPWSYEVVETKLAKSTKASALIQLCFYSDLLARIQGLEPKRMHVVLGRSEGGGGAKAEEFRVQRYLAYFRKVRREFQAALVAKPITYPEPVEHCHVCSWFPNCDKRRHTDDHLSLVAGITRNQRKALVECDITKLAQLAEIRVQRSENRGQRSEVRSQISEVGSQRSEVGEQRSENRGQRSEVGNQRSEVRRIAAAPLLRIREQARVQMRGRNEKRPVHELLEPVEIGRGLAALPLPSQGDLFLDFEGDPFAFEQGLEYLVGVVSEGNFGFRIADFEFKDEENFGFRIADFEFKSRELRGEKIGLREESGLREKKFEIRNSPAAIRNSPAAIRNSPAAIRNSPAAIRNSL